VAEYYRKLAAREGFQRAVVGVMAENRPDTICFPACRILPQTREEFRNVRWTVMTYPTNTVIATQSWMPSICVPAGFSPAGIPVGMEMIVPPYRTRPVSVRIRLRAANPLASGTGKRSSALSCACSNTASPLGVLHRGGLRPLGRCCAMSVSSRAIATARTSESQSLCFTFASKRR
jgi:hypothetical protein